MEGEWTEYEYIDEEDLAQPDFYVDQFYPTGGLQVSAKFPFTMTSMDPKSTLGHLHCSQVPQGTNFVQNGDLMGTQF